MALTKKNELHGRRLSFDVFELLEAAGGFARDDGFAVMPMKFIDQIRGELERLYLIQDSAAELREFLLSHRDGFSLADLDPLLNNLKETAV